MFTVTLNAKATIIDLLNVRLFLQKMNVAPTSEQEYTAHRVFFPSNQDFEKNAFNQSLTIQSIGKSDQIRFLLLQEINKYWGLILIQLLDKYSDLKIEIYQSQNLGEGSKSFFDWIAQNTKTKISYHSFQTLEDKSYLLNELELTPEERWILDITQYPSTMSTVDQKRLFGYAHRYLCVGDAWTCININNLLLSHQPKFVERIYEDLGFAHNALAQTYQAEFFIKKWLNLSTRESKITALYVYSVILSRYRPKYFKDYKKAIDCLDESYAHLQSLKHTLPSGEFLHLQNTYNFTLNGKAYILFQQKKYEEAIEVLQEGLDFIDKNPTLKIPMSYSLFVYNLTQAYRQMKNKEKTIETYEKLLEIDPSDAYYHIDFASYYIDLEEFDKAVEFINKGLKINSDLPVAHAVLGYIYLQQDKQNQSEFHYKKAFDLLPNNPEYLYNYAYALALQERYQEMINLLDANEWQMSDQKAWLEFSKSYYLDFLFLYVEGLANCDQLKEAIQLLRESQSKFPNQSQIQENLKLLEETLIQI